MSWYRVVGIAGLAWSALAIDAWYPFTDDTLAVYVAINLVLFTAITLFTWVD
jgi:hypothetical protein